MIAQLNWPYFEQFVIQGVLNANTQVWFWCAPPSRNVRQLLVMMIHSFFNHNSPLNKWLSCRKVKVRISSSTISSKNKQKTHVQAQSEKRISDMSKRGQNYNVQTSFHSNKLKLTADKCNLKSISTSSQIKFPMVNNYIPIQETFQFGATWNKKISFPKFSQIEIDRISWEM